MKATHQTAAALALGTLLLSAAHGSAMSGEPFDTPVDALKRLYRVCERASMNGTLSANGATFCSSVYERLKRRGFGDNFEKFSAWAKTQHAHSMRHVGRR
jgi:hypothetical protein